MGQLTLKQLSAGYPGHCVIENMSLEVIKGEIIALLGPSGEGKTTILKTIAGLLPPLSGDILINQQLVNSIPAEKRDVVLVFQKPLLFPFLNVEENIGFGLRMQGVNRKQIRNAVYSMAELTGLKGMERRKISQLSGGQQQRVALARGLVLRPAILLLDEPLSNLDADLRAQMRELIGSVCRKTGITTMFVTHDQSEALTISDRVALLLNGSLRQVGPPDELFYAPRDTEVARFFGCTNLLSGSVRASLFSASTLSLPLDAPDQDHCTLAIRPERIKLSQHPVQGSLPGIIREIRFEGLMTRLTVQVRTVEMTVLVGHCLQKPGDTTHLLLPDNALHIIKEDRP